jgi:hypothetical protein
MMRNANQQVNPKIAAILILTVLVVIQIVWWRGLVARPRGKGSSGSPRGAPLPPGPPTLVGRKDVGVDTLAGAPDPGDDNGPANAARFDGPLGIAVDRQGNVIVADSRNHRIREISPTGTTRTLAGTVAGYEDGPALTAKFCCPCGVAVGPDDAVYVADTGNGLIRRVKDGVVTTLTGIARPANRPGWRYLPDSLPHSTKLPGNVPRETALLKAPCSLSYVGGNPPFLYVADTLDRRVEAIDLQGNVISVRRLPGAPLGVLGGVEPMAAVVGAGIVSLSDRSSGGKSLPTIPIDMQGEDGPQAQFTLRHPVALAHAPDGWFVADGKQPALFYVRTGRAELIAGMCRVSPSAADWRDADGEKARFGQVGGLATDGRGLLYVSDTSNNAIRRITLPPDLRGRQEARP